MRPTLARGTDGFDRSEGALHERERPEPADQQVWAAQPPRVRRANPSSSITSSSRRPPLRCRSKGSTAALRELLARQIESDERRRADFTLPSYHGGGFLVDILDKEALADALGDNDPR